MPTVVRVLVAFALLLSAPLAHAALTPDNLLLIVNRNDPNSQRLAEFYQTARQVPPGRILALNLPVQEDVALGFYEREVVPAVRDYLRKNQLEEKVTCLVTFYGVPLRVGRRVANAVEQREATYLQEELKKVLARTTEKITQLESQVRGLDPSFSPVAGDDFDHLSARAEAALRQLTQRAASSEDPAEQQSRVNTVVDATRLLGGPAAVLRIFAARAGAAGGEGAATDADRAKLAELHASVQQAMTEINQLSESRWDATARQRIRTLAASSIGSLGVARILAAQHDYLSAANPVASFDNELAMLWWPAYPRDQWRPNLLNYRMMHMRGAGGEAPPKTLMVIRLDAPQPGIVREIILASLRAERDGLKGRVVLDSRGIHSKEEESKAGTYAWYDQSIRNLGEIIRTKTKLSMLHDESPGVLAPGSAGNVAIYCGWYSVRNYVPACQFVPGAVGFHVASYELVSLRDPNERGWGRGLLTDGLSSTAGAVAEPYLHAFPLADDFFPLLLTGKLPLAEVYWRTTPLTSWMLSMIGDPLYTPFQKNPQLTVEDLPARLQPLLTEAPATQPTTQPVPAK